MMNEQRITRIIIQQCRSSVWYSEEAAASVSHLGIDSIRQLRMLGLITGLETDGEVRYSEEEVIQLRKIRRLQHDLGINLAGVEVIVGLLKRLEQVYQDYEQENKQAHPDNQ